MKPARACLAPVALAAALLAGGCGAGAQEQNSVAVAVTGDEDAAVNRMLDGGERVRVDDELKRMGPEGWQRLALYANWDFTQPEVWRWIVSQPDCDKATALAIFWKAEPEYYLQYKDRSQVRAAELDSYDLLALIRERWQAGAYTHAAFAFDPDMDAWPLDRAALTKQFGARVERDLPASMRVKLAGRVVPDQGAPLPGTMRM